MLFKHRFVNIDAQARLLRHGYQPIFDGESLAGQGLTQGAVLDTIFQPFGVG